MKKITTLMIALLLPVALMAQKIGYKAGILQVDGKDLAKIVKIKDKGNFGLTSTYELYAMGGEKLIIATIATDFVPDRGDNSKYYYRLTFLTANQTGIFSLNKLGAEKSFAKLIGESGIVMNDQLDSKLVTELIAMKSRNPVVRAEYHLVERNFSFPVNIKENQVYQEDVLIGQFKDITDRRHLDTYEFSLPSGLVIARVSFTGGNSAQNCTVTTNKDGRTQYAAIPSKGIYGKLLVRSEGMDRNAIVLKQIAMWLVKNNYM